MNTANWLDRAIGFVSPRAGIRRIRARAAFDGATRSYAGAADSRHTDGWTAHATSADAELLIGGRKLRDRARDLVRNNHYAAKGVTNYATDLIGHGITPRPNSKDKKTNEKVKELFDEWSKQCDADGQLDFYGLQTLAVREMIEGGEILARRRWRRKSDGLRVPVQIQLLESDFIDPSRNGLMDNGNAVINGIEFDVIGRRSAYWMFRHHPGNAFFPNLLGNYQSDPIPASEIAHLYEKQRTQARGASWFAPVLRKMRDIDDYDFAEGIRKKIEASVTAFVSGEDDDLSISAQGEANAKDGQPQGALRDAYGNVLEKIAPGLIGYLRGNRQVTFNHPANVGGYEEYKRVSAREIATGLRQPYEYLTGDLSNVNFSSARVGIIAYRRFCEQVQWQIIVPMYLQRAWDWFTEAAYTVGEIDTPTVPVEWDMPKWQAIEPYKDAMADMISLRLGRKTWAQVVAESGYNPDDQLAEIAEWNKKIDAVGAIFDGDPRNVTLAGVMQKLMTDGVSPDSGQQGK